MAEGVIAEDPVNVMAHLVLVADRLRAGDAGGGLARVEAGLAAAPDDEGLHLARLALLEQKGDPAAVGDELATMSRLFPDNTGVRAALVQWHLKNGAPDAAEALLRTAADADPGQPGPGLTLAQFLLEVRGPNAARAELTARAAAGADPGARAPYVRALAGLDFAQGRQDTAIAALRGLIEGAPATDATRDTEVALAEMLAETGEAAESAALLEKVLAADRTHLGALKLRARAAIAADRPDAAIQDMRTALTIAPRDPEVMTIMAFAHERDGDRGLMGERLALAVEASNRAPTESLRYANFLMQENRPGPAEGVVTDALRRDPDNLELLEMLGRIHLARKDWPRAGQVAGILRAQGDPVAAAMATSLDTARLRREGKPEAAAVMLEALTFGGPGGGPAGDPGGEVLAGLVRARLAAGEPGEARRAVEAALAGDPRSIPARYLLAGLDAIEGRTDAAEAGYRALVAEAPALPEPHRALFRLLAGEGDLAGADTALEEGIAATGDANGELLFLRAGLRETRGNLAGAIADYETLYARSSDSPVLANNLASLLTAQGSDAATLERAHAIARRLRGSEVPEFQDTYGWILFLRGDAARAREYLAKAGAALPGNAQVQFHLGEAERTLGNRDAATAAYAAALAAAEAGSPLPQAGTVRARASELAAPAPAAPPSDG
jgi:predicted Zn-dependent protease